MPSAKGSRISENNRNAKSTAAKKSTRRWHGVKDVACCRSWCLKLPLMCRDCSTQRPRKAAQFRGYVIAAMVGSKESSLFTSFHFDWNLRAATGNRVYETKNLSKLLPIVLKSIFAYAEFYLGRRQCNDCCAATRNHRKAKFAFQSNRPVLCSMPDSTGTNSRPFDRRINGPAHVRPDRLLCQQC